jgi:hypothetical protein
MFIRHEAVEGFEGRGESIARLAGIRLILQNVCRLTTHEHRNMPAHAGYCNDMGMFIICLQITAHASVTALQFNF